MGKSNQREEKKTMKRDKEASGGVNCSNGVFPKASRLRNNKVSFAMHWKTS